MSVGQENAPLRITMFGGLRLERGGQPLPPFSTHKARALFAYLVTFRDRRHPRAVLAGLLWPEAPQDRARRNLSDALWRLRRVVGPNVILTGEDALAFNTAADYWLDIEEFERLVDWEIEKLGDWGSGSQPTNLPIYQSTNLRDAVELYRGDFLEGFYDDWAIRERERLRLRYLDALERLLVWRRDRGELAQALDYGLRLAAADPLRESAHRQVMLLYHRLGRRAAALQQFETCRRILRDELEADPLPETVRLAAEIRQSPAAPAAPHSPFDGLGRAPLVGRRRERADLLARLDAAAAGRGGLVLIEGEAGVGKSRLAEETAAGAEWRGFQVLWGACRDRPYAPLVEALTGALTPLRAAQLARLVEPATLAALVPLLPVLADLPDLPPLSALDPAEERARLHRALVRCLRALGRIAPHLLILEDWQWMDPATAQLLPLLARRLPDSRLLLIGTARSGELRDRAEVWQPLLALDQGGSLAHLMLDRLSAVETGELLGGLLGQVHPLPDLVERLHGGSLGNPLYAIEWLRALIEQGRLRREADGGWRLSEAGDWPPPPAVLRLIAARLERLPAEERRLLAGAAVLDDPFDFDLWRLTTGLAAADLLAGSEVLLRRRFITEAAAGYRFTHDLVRQAAYEQIAPQERRRWHRRAGQALESLRPQAVDALARHFFRGGEWRKAWRYALQAGEQAARVYAHEQAATHFSRALTALRRAEEAGQVQPDEVREARVRLLKARETAWGLLGRQAERRADIEALLALARARDDARLRGSAYRRLAFYHIAVGDHAQAHETAQRALRLAQAADDLEAQAHLHGALGSVWYVLEDYARSFDHYQTARDLFERLGDRDGTARMLAGMCWSGTHTGRYLEALRYGEMALQTHRALGNLNGQMQALSYLGLLYRYGGLFRQALAYHRETVRISREIDDRLRTAISLRELGVLLRETGAYEEAETCLDESLTISREIGARRGQIMALVTLGDLRYCQERYAEALDLHRRALALNEEVGLKHFRFHSHWTLSRAFQALGQHELAALDHARRALQAAREADVTSDVTCALSNLARVLLTAGRKAEALRRSQEAVALFEQVGYVEEAEEEVLFNHFWVLHALGREAEAAGYLTWAYQRMVQKSQELEGDARCHFLERLPLNRAIAAEYARRRDLSPGQCRFTLPSAAAPGERVEVVWTVDAGEPDAALRAAEGKVALRRARLRRLLAEAQAQGAAPTQADLARALGVSRRTIRNDLANSEWRMANSG